MTIMPDKVFTLLALDSWNVILNLILNSYIFSKDGFNPIKPFRFWDL